MKVPPVLLVLASSCLAGCAAADKLALAIAPEQILSLANVPHDRVAKPALDARPKPKSTQSPPKPQPALQDLPQPILPSWSIAAQRPSKTLGNSLPASELFNRLKPSIYTVSSGRSQGSAVAVSAKELVTACHVVSGSPAVTLSNGADIMKADLVGADLATDRCFLRVQDGELAPIAGIRDYSTLSVGEAVFTIGSPRGLANTLGAGLLSGLRIGENKTEYIQITAPLSPGSSGGGVFDDRGNLIGVTSFTVPDSQSLNFAIAASQFWR